MPISLSAARPPPPTQIPIFDLPESSLIAGAKSGIANSIFDAVGISPTNSAPNKSAGIPIYPDPLGAFVKPDMKSITAAIALLASVTLTDMALPFLIFASGVKSAL